VVTAVKCPAEVVFGILNEDWATANVPKPKIVQREVAEEIREKVPAQGLLVIYAESGGVRISPRGNRMYKDERVNVIVECHSLKSHEHWYQLIEEAVRIIELHTHDVSPYQEIRPLSYAEEYGTTFRYWRGNVRCELENAAVRTGYVGP